MALAPKTRARDARDWRRAAELCFLTAASKLGSLYLPHYLYPADGLAVPTVGGNAFEVARAHTDEVVIVEESDVALSVLRLLENEKVIVEGGGATGLAAILPGGPMHKEVQGKRVAVPLCGGNIDVTTLGRVIDRG